MVTVDASFKALASAASLAFGLLVLAGGPRRPANQALSVFLLLLAGNQAAEAMRAFAPDVEGRLLWRRAASVFAALDPAALAYFASVFPERNALNRTRLLAPALALAAGFALYGGWLLGPGESPQDIGPATYGMLLSAYTAAVYALVLAWGLRGLARAPGSRTWVLLCAALAVAALPRVALLVQDLLYGLTWGVGPFEPVAVQPIHLASIALASMGAASGLAILLLRRAGPGRHDASRRAARAGLALGLGLSAGLILFNALVQSILLPAGWEHFHAAQVPGRAFTAARWLLFGALVSTAVLRHDALGMGVRARRRAARVFVGVFVLGAGVVAASLLGDATSGIPPWGLVAMGAAVVLSQGFRSLVDHIAWRVYGLPREGDAAARLEAYRVALAQALAQGRSLDDPALRRLREDLSLDERTAEVLADAAESSRGPLAPGQLVARRYRVVRPLGRGGGGRVFLARDERLARDVALKEVPADSPAHVEQALHEARLAGGIGHPNVVTLHDALVRGGAVLLVTEHVPGGSLEERVRERGRLPAAEGAALLAGVLRGLAEIHRRGIVHRDLKPANVLLDAAGTPKIADFGLARIGGESATKGTGAGGASGTPAYMAPEQRRGEPATRHTDVHAAGLIARACLADPLPPLVDEVVARALREDPSERWADAGEMLAALERALARPHAQ